MAASHGVPRIINNLCFNALSLCCEQKRKQVDADIAAEAIAIQELDPEARKKITDRWERAARQPLQPEQSILPEQLREPEKPHQTEQMFRPEQPLPERTQPRQSLQREQPLQLEQVFEQKEVLQPKALQAEQLLKAEEPAQRQGPKRILRRLMVPAAAVLLVASGAGLFSLSRGWLAWSGLAGSKRPLDTKSLSGSGPQSSKPDTSTAIAAAPASAPSPVNTTSIPAPATEGIPSATVTGPPVKAAPSRAKAPPPPVSAPAVAKVDRVSAAESPAKSTPSAARALSLPISASAAANMDRVTAAEPTAKTTPAREPEPIAQPSTAQAHLSQAPGARSNANVTPSAPTAAARNPVGGNRGAADSTHAASKVAHASLPSVIGTGGRNYGKVAPADIPGVVKGTRLAKMPVAPVPEEMLPKPIDPNNPAEQDTPNCGGVFEMPCPKLQIRPAPPPN
jgi:hypothetical protein